MVRIVPAPCARGHTDGPCGAGDPAWAMMERAARVTGDRSRRVAPLAAPAPAVAALRRSDWRGHWLSWRRAVLVQRFQQQPCILQAADRGGSAGLVRLRTGRGHAVCPTPSRREVRHLRSGLSAQPCASPLRHRPNPPPLPTASRPLRRPRSSCQLAQRSVGWRSMRRSMRVAARGTRRASRGAGSRVARTRIMAKEWSRQQSGGQAAASCPGASSSVTLHAPCQTRVLRCCWGGEGSGSGMPKPYVAEQTHVTDSRRLPPRRCRRGRRATPSATVSHAAHCASCSPREMRSTPPSSRC